MGFDSVSAEEALGSPLRHADVQLSPGTELGASYTMPRWRTLLDLFIVGGARPTVTTCYHIFGMNIHLPVLMFGVVLTHGYISGSIQ